MNLTIIYVSVLTHVVCILIGFLLGRSSRKTEYIEGAPKYVPDPDAPKQAVAEFEDPYRDAADGPVSPIGGKLQTLEDE